MEVPVRSLDGVAGVSNLLVALGILLDVDDVSVVADNRGAQDDRGTSRSLGLGSGDGSGLSVGGSLSLGCGLGFDLGRRRGLGEGRSRRWGRGDLGAGRGTAGAGSVAGEGAGTADDAVAFVVSDVASGVRDAVLVGVAVSQSKIDLRSNTIPIPALVRLHPCWCQLMLSL